VRDGQVFVTDLRAWKRPPLDALRWFVSPRHPYYVDAAGLRAARPSVLRDELDRYDLVWVTKAESYLVFGDRFPSGAVVDLDDIEHRKTADLVNVGRAGRDPVTFVRHLRDRRDVGAWRRFETEVANAAAVAVVASPDDLDVFPRTAVVANGYPPPPAGWQRRPADDVVLLLQGQFGYFPNEDAARWVTSTVMPRVWSRLPDATLRLVGAHPPWLREVVTDGRVVLTGFVPDIRDELSRASMIVCPIRFGGGTRVKLIEALAHRVPIATTTIGAAGLGLVHGVHALVADDADAFADAVVDLARDPRLGTSLTENGYQHYLTRFTPDVVEQQVAAVVERLR
jgi:glycosyltransferase involved in cell wall biosynthesis